MQCQLEAKQQTEKTEEVFPKETENTIRDTIYSVGIDQTPNLKEQITQIHVRIDRLFDLSGFIVYQRHNISNMNGIRGNFLIHR